MSNDKTDPNAQGEPAQGTRTAPDDPGQSAANPDTGPKWRYQLEKDLQDHPEVLKHESPNGIVRAYIDYASRADRMVEIPGPDSDAAVHEAYYKKVRPESPDKYRIEPDPEFPKEIPRGENYLEDYRKMAHDAGLTNDQAVVLYRWLEGRTEKLYHDTERSKYAAMQEELDDLKNEWGDKFDGKIKEVQQAYKKVGGQEFADFFNGTGLADHPRMLRFFSSVWDRIKDDSMITGTQDGAEPEAYLKEWYPNTNFS